jgi:hypothetical protein
MCPTIPGEDPREFQELHLALIDEREPSGRSEEGAVFSLADLMWRGCKSDLRLNAERNASRKFTSSLSIKT